MTQHETHRDDEAFALRMDREDPLAGYRERFAIPLGEDGRPLIYFCGNSLGLMPHQARTDVLAELDDWARLGVAGHFDGRRPWYSYHEQFREPAARLVGALPDEVVMMNGLTVNLHLLLVSFYRPTPARFRILMQSPEFPSDLYALQSQARFHGQDPDDALIVARPRGGEDLLQTGDLERIIAERGGEIALLHFSAVNYYNGQFFDVERITRAARAAGIVVGWDLAHAAGNVPLALHDWGVDYAVWCSYKYLNSGPGALAGAFVHQRHGGDPALNRFAGWWGNDPATRFNMHEESRFVARNGADGWQLSNPPIFSAAPLVSSLALFDEAGMPALRAKSVRLTGYLEWLIRRMESPRLAILTPDDPARRGCQLSVRVRRRARELFHALERRGVICDFRQPDVIRVAPVPLYNTFHEAWAFAQALAKAVAETNSP